MDWQEVLKRAMRLEQDGREFYLRAAQLSEDEEIRQMFRKLADDELSHYNYLQREYAEILCSNRWCEIPDLEDVEPIDVKEPIFPLDKDLSETLPDDASLEDTLLFALTAEDATVELYQESAEKVEDPNAKALFSNLAAVEMRHFSTVLQRYESRYSYPR